MKLKLYLLFAWMTLLFMPIITYAQNEGASCEEPYVAVVGENISDHRADENQWFSYTAETDQLVSIYTYGYTSNVDSYLEIFSDCETIIKRNDDYNGTYQSYIEHRVLAGETIFIRWRDDYLTSETMVYPWKLDVVDYFEGINCTYPEVVNLGEQTISAGLTTKYFLVDDYSKGYFGIEYNEIQDVSIEFTVYDDCSTRNPSQTTPNDMLTFFSDDQETFLIKAEVDDRRSVQSDLSFNIIQIDEEVGEGAVCNDAIELSIGNFNPHINSPLHTVWYAYQASEATRLKIKKPNDTEAEIKAFWSCNSSSPTEESQDSLSIDLSSGEVVMIQISAPVSGESQGWQSSTESLVGAFCDDPLDAEMSVVYSNPHAEYDLWLEYTATSSGVVEVNLSESGRITRYDFDCSYISDGVINNRFEVTAGESYLLRCGIDQDATVELSERPLAAGDVCDLPKHVSLGTFNNEGAAWLSFTAENDGPIQITPECSGIDNGEEPFVKVITGCDEGDIVELKNFDCNSEEGHQPLTFYAQAGQNYLVFFREFGEGNVSIEEVDGISNGEYCGVARTLTTSDTVQMGNNHVNWFSFTAEEEGKTTVSLTNGNPTSFYLMSGCSEYLDFESAYYLKPSNESFDFYAEVGETYIFRVVSGESAEWTINKIDEYEAGEHCKAPLSATAGINFADNRDERDQWYIYEAFHNGEITISTCDLTTEDTYLRVFTDCENLYDFADDNCGYQQELTLDVEIGDIFYINYGGDFTTGSYRWELTESIEENKLEGSLAISGDLIFDQELMVTLDQVNSTDIQLQWYRGSEPIIGATSVRYTLVKEDIGKYIKVRAISPEKQGTLTGISDTEIHKISTMAPESPVIVMMNNGKLWLQSHEGYEYKLNEGDWQSDPEFSGLTVGEAYLFYQRLMETETHAPSPASEALTFNMEKEFIAGQLSIDGSRVFGSLLTLEIEGQNFTAQEIKWYRNGDQIEGAESKTYILTSDDINAVISVDVASSETYGKLMYEDEEAVTKATQTAPSIPVLDSSDDNSVELLHTEGYEYKMDDGDWQAESSFTGLSVDNTYIFYQRVAETETHFMSEASAGLSITISVLSNDDARKVSIYPNPVKDILNIKLQGTAQVKLLDISGRKWLEKTVIETDGIDVKHLPSGVYFVEVTQHNHSIVTKIIIE
ncbi:T9SS type A sorting domain-containing protein [Persicobacter psychrovividus]|uniref:Secretion system C-terminal sorting domain-containing protein n=1 Tax=Persicobacter psychrovividus TaxID=387638 RepID=A0ABN6LF99_9BACT|nr:hypothetical protein PEPS_41410 [Persicobacter psychrovividus]